MQQRMLLQMTKNLIETRVTRERINRLKCSTKTILKFVLYKFENVYLIIYNILINNPFLFWAYKKTSTLVCYVFSWFEIFGTLLI